MCESDIFMFCCHGTQDTVASAHVNLLYMLNGLCYFSYILSAWSEQKVAFIHMSSRIRCCWNEASGWSGCRSKV